MTLLNYLLFASHRRSHSSVLLTMTQNNHDRSFLPFKIIREEKEQRFVDLSSSAPRETKVVLRQRFHHWVRAEHLSERQFLRTALHRPKQKVLTFKFI